MCSVSHPGEHVYDGGTARAITQQHYDLTKEQKKAFDKRCGDLYKTCPSHPYIVNFWLPSKIKDGGLTLPQFCANVHSGAQYTTLLVDIIEISLHSQGMDIVSWKHQISKKKLTCCSDNIRFLLWHDDRVRDTCDTYSVHAEEGMTDGHLSEPVHQAMDPLQCVNLSCPKDPAPG